MEKELIAQIEHFCNYHIVDCIEEVKAQDILDMIDDYKRRKRNAEKKSFEQR